MSLQIAHPIVYNDTAYTIYEYPYSINSLLSFRKYEFNNVSSAHTKGRLSGEALQQSFLKNQYFINCKTTWA